MAIVGERILWMLQQRRLFLTYFLFEALIGKSLHPALYALVSMARTIFYLLLLSLAEQLGFDLSFPITGISTVALSFVNTEWIFLSRKLALRALAAFRSLYAFIYVLLRLEAHALLVGATASFAAVYITRNIDWYGNAVLTSGSSAPVSPDRAAQESWLE